MTTQGTETVTIQASPETVWPWIVNLDKHADWSPKSYRVELLSGEAGAVGARYRSFGVVPGDKDHENEVEITEVVPERRLVLTARDENGAFTNTLTLTPSGTGTLVSFQLTFPPMKGMAKFLVPILFPTVGKGDMRKRMALLKATVESTG